jgi:hypothetical protein
MDETAEAGDLHRLRLTLVLSQYRAECSRRIGSSCQVPSEPGFPWFCVGANPF